MVCLGNELRSFCRFWDYTQVLLHFGLFCWLWGLLTSSKGVLPTAVDIMVIWIQVAPFPSVLVHWFLKCRCSLLLSPVWPHLIYLEFNIPGSYVILFFTALDTFSTRNIHNWSLFLLWFSPHFFGATSPLFSWLAGLIFQCPIFLPFHTVHGVLKARMLEWFAIPFSSGHLSELSTYPVHLGWPCTAWLIVSLS